MNRRHFIKATATAASATAASVATSQSAYAAAAPASAANEIVPLATSVARRAGIGLPDLSPAKWIWYPSVRTLACTFVLFRRELELSDKPIRATGWIMADSRYRLEVNGTRIQWGPAPSDPRWAEADPLDLTQQLQAGRNVIGATVLFFGHGDGTWVLGKPGFLFRLEIEHAGRTKTTVVSDGAWQAHLCRAWPPGRYPRWHIRALQEHFDARLYPHGWSAAAFRSNQDWIPAMELGGSPNLPALCTDYVGYAPDLRGDPYQPADPAAVAELRPRSIPMLKEVEVSAKALAESLWIEWSRPPNEYFEYRAPNAFKAVRQPSAKEDGPDAWSIDADGKRGAALTFEFEEGIVGFPYFTIEAPAGTTVDLLTHEGHKVGGEPLLYTTRTYSWAHFICREGENRFEWFDFDCLRWLQLHVHGATGRIRIRNVGVRRRLYPWQHQPVVRSDEPGLQRLFDACCNNIRNVVGDIISADGSRERQQWSGDGSHQLEPIRLFFGETRAPDRYITTYSQGITSEGFFMHSWPSWANLSRFSQRTLGVFHSGTLIDFGVEFCLCCYHHYLYTGNIEPLREAYPRLLRFATYLHSLIRRDGLLPVENVGLVETVHVDYQAFRQSSGKTSGNSQRHKQCAFNLESAYMFQHALPVLCEAFGDREQARQVAEIGRGLLERTTAKFWSTQHRMFVDNLPWLAEEGEVSLSDRALATAVGFDQCPNGDIEPSVRTLAESPANMGQTFPGNAVWRFRALAKAGRVDVVVKDLRERWAVMPSVVLNNTMQEHWRIQPDSASQWCHSPMAPLQVASDSIAGLRPLTPGYGRVEIRPQLADLGGFELVARTIHGPLHFKTEGKRGARTLTITLPASCEGELVLPLQENVALPLIAKSETTGQARYRLDRGSDARLQLRFT